MKIVLLGAPGCGKGTQALKISKGFNLPHISTGEIFRENIKNCTPVGIEIKKLIDAGDLAPDELTVEIVKERLSRSDCKDGYLLDGFPRTIAQAIALDKFNSPSIVFDVNVPIPKLEKRITGRRLCEKCNSSFHTSNIGDVKTCPKCGGNLYVRKDDNIESVKERFVVYKQQTEPLIDFYKNQNKLVVIDGDQSVNTVYEAIEKVLNNDND